MLTKLTALAFAVALLAGCGSNEQAPAAFPRGDQGT